MRNCNLIYLVVPLVFACTGINSKEMVDSYHENGQPELVLFYPDASNTSYYRKTYFYKNGSIKTQGFKKNGFRDSSWLWYYRDGQLEDSIFFIDGKMTGKRKYWYPDGTIEAVAIFDEKTNYHCKGEDSLSGYFKYYYPNGQLREENYMKYGKFHGRTQMYYEDGSPMKDLYEEQGIKNGRYQEWDTLGNTVIGSYQDGEKFGHWKWFNEEGQLIAEEEYN